MYILGRKKVSKIILSILVASIMMMPLFLDNDVKASVKNEEIFETNIKLDSRWIKHFPGTSWAHVVRETDDGYVVVGATNIDISGDGLVMKVDKNGTELWNRTFSNAAFEGLWVTSDSGYIVSGWRIELPEQMGILVKLDKNGTVEWENTYGGPVCGFIQCQQTIDGGYVASGGYGVPEGNGNGWLLKTDENGNVLLNKTYGFENSTELFHSIHETSDGGFILPGWTSIPPEQGLKDMGADGWVVKTDADGNEEWQQFYDTGTSIIGLDKVDNINMGRQDLDGGYIFTGWSSATFFTDKGAFWIFKTDKNGNVSWNKTYGKLWFHDLGLWVEPTTDGGYIAAGKRYGIGTLPNIILKALYMPIWNNLWVIKTDLDGEILWDVTYIDATARCVQETTDGGYIIAGHKGPYYGTKGILLIKTDENGNT